MNIQTNDISVDHELVVDAQEMSFFPSQIFALQVPDADQLNAKVLSDIHDERERDRKGIQRSNFRALGGWHSHNNLHQDPRFETLVRFINAMGQKVSQQNGYHRGYELKIGTMWSIINAPGSSNRAHIHPSCHWSGVYYVQAPEGSGDIEFIDPRTQNLIMQPRYIPNKKRPKNCWTKVHFQPVPGKMLIFPSWLYHSVNPNLSTETGTAGERVVISFNLNQQKIVDQAV